MSLTLKNSPMNFQIESGSFYFEQYPDQHVYTMVFLKTRKIDSQKARTKIYLRIHSIL
jgi:hypothetical protein